MEYFYLTNILNLKHLDTSMISEQKEYLDLCAKMQLGMLKAKTHFSELLRHQDLKKKFGPLVIANKDQIRYRIIHGSDEIKLQAKINTYVADGWEVDKYTLTNMSNAYGKSTYTHVLMKTDKTKLT